MKKTLEGNKKRGSEEDSHTQSSSSVSHTKVKGDLSVSSHMETNQPMATASGNTVSGDLNIKVIGKYEKHIHQPPSPEEKRIVSQQYLEDALQQLRRYRLKDEGIQAELATYVPVQGGQSFEDNELFDVVTKVKEFLADQKKVLLLLGDSGIGKSVFGQMLERELWQNYSTNQPIPLFIPLPSLEDPLKHAVDGHLSQLGFKPQQIAQLKQSHSFIIILDGYDEIASHNPDNLYVSNQLSNWNAKVIINCRSQYLLVKKEMYRNRFLPVYKNQPEPGLYQEIVLKPFTPAQIETYLKKFVEVEKPIWSDWQVYQKHIEAIPDLKGMIETPFLLRITVEVLPDIAERFEDKKDTQRTTLMRVNLYDAFVQRWFERQEFRLKEQGTLTDPDCDIKSDFREFSQRLATKMFQKGINEIILEPKATRFFGQTSVSPVKNEWDEFFGNAPDLQLVRSGCPLKKIGENRYTFIHKSLLEYFGARQLFDQIADLQASQVKTTSKKKVKEVVLPSTTLAGLDINQKLLNEEPSMILFLADLVKQDGATKKLLFALIEQSKIQAEVKVAAANAMTILKVANVIFSGMDFSLIKIPGADLSGGVFDHTNFSHADLRGVNFDQAWLRGTNASYGNLRGMQLGQRPYLKHGEIVRAIAYSRDGRYLAVASGKDIVLWDQVRGEKVCTLRGHTYEVWSVSFNPNGQVVASGSSDKTVRLWEVKSGRSRTLSGHADGVESVAFSPDGRVVASGSSDKTVRLWEVKSGRSRTLSGHADRVESVAFSPDGQIVASGSWDNTVRLWEVKSGQSRTLSGHANGVESVAFSSDGQVVASGSSDKTVRLWEVKSGRSRTLSGHAEGIESVAFSPDGQVVASGSWDNTVRLWEMKNGQSRMLIGHKNGVSSVSFSPDGQTVASGGVDCTVRLWEVKSGRSRTLSGHTKGVESVAFSPDGQVAASGSWDNTVRLWEMKNGRSRMLIGHKNGVSSVSFSPDGQTVASGSWDNTVRLWEVQSGQSRTLSGHTGKVSSVAFSPDGQTVASGSVDRTVRLWEVQSGQSRTLSGHTGEVSSVAFSPDGQTVASGSMGDCTVRLWEVQSGQSRTLSGHEAEVSSVAFSPDGRTVASGSVDRTVRLWDVKSGQSRVLNGHTEWVRSVCFSPDGQMVASGSRDKTVRLWEVKSGQCVAVLQGYLGGYLGAAAVTSVCFKDADTLATGSDDCAVKLWRKVATSQGDIWQLQWSSHVALYCEDMLIEGAQGLTPEQQQLLEQQGAKGTPDVQSTLEDDNSKSSYFLMWQKPQKQEESEEDEDERNSEEDEDKHSESFNKFP